MRGCREQLEAFKGLRQRQGKAARAEHPGFRGQSCPLPPQGMSPEALAGSRGGSQGGHYQRREPRQLVGMGPVTQASVPRGDGHLSNWRLPGICPKNNGSCRYRIGPTEVENALAEHPAVAESAVVSSPDPARGEVRKTRKVSDWLGVPGKAGGKGNLISPGRRTCAMRSPEGAVGLSPARSGAAGHSMTAGLLFHFYS